MPKISDFWAKKTMEDTPARSLQDGADKDNNSEPKSDDELEYPPLGKVILIMGALYISMFLVSLDRIIIATAIPRITDNFHSLPDIGWYASVYMLAACSTQLLFGRLYLFYPIKHIFLASVILFEAGSVLCAAAPTSAAFITGRAVAGVGSAGVFSGVMVIMIPLCPLEKRPLYMGILGSIFGIASIVGPLVGGAFTNNEHLTWRWCFWINLPFGAVTLCVVTIFLHIQPPPKGHLDVAEKLRSLDPLGFLLFAPAIVSLLLALQWGGTERQWRDPQVVALLVVFGVLLAAWVIVQVRGGERATIPRRVFAQRSIISGFCFSACVGGIIIVTSYYLPIWFQAVDGVDALQSGIRGLPYVLAVIAGSMLAGGLVSKVVGYYAPFTIVSACGMSVGTGLLSTLRVDSGPPEWIGYQFILGFTMGLGMQQSALAAQVVLTPDNVSIGASIMFFAQSLGGSVFICVAQNVFLQELVKNLTGVLDDQTGNIVELVQSVGATQLRDVVPSELLPAVLRAYNKTISTAIYVAVAIACVSLLPALGFEWRSVKVKGAARRGGGNESADREKPGV